jgi:hypothetical protein
MSELCWVVLIPAGGFMSSSGLGDILPPQFLHHRLVIQTASHDRKIDRDMKLIYTNI